MAANSQKNQRGVQRVGTLQCNAASCAVFRNDCTAGGLINRARQTSGKVVRPWWWRGRELSSGRFVVRECGSMGFEMEFCI